MAKITILGSGGFGTSLAVMAHKYGHEVSLWSAFSEEIEHIRKYGENKKLLPGILVDNAIELTTDLNCAKGADLLIFAVPSSVVRKVANQVKEYVTPNSICVNVGKGLEDETLMRLSEVITQELPNNKFVALTGPSHAEEIARGVPTSILAVSNDIEAAKYVQDVLMNKSLRIYLNDDLVGAELGGAFKNIIAVAAGICDGLGLGDNTKAALMTRGLAEITRLAISLGGKIETMAGLAGLGDLIVTCTSMHSRNRRFGILVGEGMDAHTALERIGMTVEGVVATKAAWKLSQKQGISMPIIEKMYDVIFCGAEIRTAVEDLMDRPKKHEMEDPQ